MEFFNKHSFEGVTKELFNDFKIAQTIKIFIENEIKK